MNNRVIPFKPRSSPQTQITISIRADGSTATSANTTPTDAERYALLRAIRSLRQEIVNRFAGTPTDE